MAGRALVSLTEQGADDVIAAIERVERRRDARLVGRQRNIGEMSDPVRDQIDGRGS